jgi:hypothetical protein
MTFDTQKLKRDSEKIILVEFDAPVTNDFLISDEAGIWYKVLTQEEIIVNGTVLNPDRNTIDLLDVQSVKVIKDDKIYNFIKVNSKADLNTNEQSFWYDKTTYSVYFHFLNYDPPLNRTIKISFLLGFCNNTGTINKGRYNDIYYKPRLTGWPSIKYKKDSTKFGIASEITTSFNFDNHDGLFDQDNFGLRTISRQEIRTYFGFDGLDKDEFQLMNRSIISNFNRSWTSYSISGEDFRDQLNKSLPLNVYATSEFPDLPDDLVSAFKPIAFGKVYKIPCNLVDDSGSPYEYHIVDLVNDELYVVSSSITVYDADGADVTGSCTIDYDTATFTYATEEDLYCDVQVGLIDDSTDYLYDTASENALDIIRKICFLLGVTFIDVNFNQTEWISEKALNSDYKVGFYIDDETKGKDIIKDICESIAAYFFTQPDGLYTVRSYYESRTPVKRIQNHEWLNDPEESNPQDQFLSSVIIKYKKDYKEDKYNNYVNTDYKEDAINNYSIANEREIKTVLSDRDSAVDLSNEILSIASEISTVWKRSVDIRHIDLRYMDFIEVCHDRDPESVDFKVNEVIGIIYDLQKFKIDLTMREVADSNIYVQGSSMDSGLYGLGTMGNGIYTNVDQSMGIIFKN